VLLATSIFAFLCAVAALAIALVVLVGHDSTGPQGAAGTNGVNGTTTTIIITNTTDLSSQLVLPVCVNGTNGFNGTDGKDGKDGICINGTNGKDGQNGRNGTNAYNITEIFYISSGGGGSNISSELVNGTATFTNTYYTKNASWWLDESGPFFNVTITPALVEVPRTAMAYFSELTLTMTFAGPWDAGTMDVDVRFTRTNDHVQMSIPKLFAVSTGAGNVWSRIQSVTAIPEEYLPDDAYEFACSFVRQGDDYNYHPFLGTCQLCRWDTPTYANKVVMGQVGGVEQVPTDFDTSTVDFPQAFLNQGRISATTFSYWANRTMAAFPSYNFAGHVDPPY
jgi:hypothetical protein